MCLRRGQSLKIKKRHALVTLYELWKIIINKLKIGDLQTWAAHVCIVGNLFKNLKLDIDFSIHTSRPPWAGGGGGIGAAGTTLCAGMGLMGPPMGPARPCGT